MRRHASRKGYCSRICFLFLCCLIFTIQAQSQDRDYRALEEISKSRWEIGFKNGINIFTLNINPQPNSLRQEFSPGYSLGIMVKNGSNTGVAYQVEPGIIRKKTRMIIPADSSIFLTPALDYLKLPLILRYQGKFNYLFGNIFTQTYIMAGWGVNYMINGKLKVEKEGINFANLQEVQDQFFPLEFFFVGGAGLRFTITRGSSFFLETRLNRGFSNINRAFIQNVQISHFGFQLMGGITAHL